jgi:hypothetical protein
MQAREKRLLRIVVTVGGAAALIYGINLLLFSPMKEAEERIVQLKREKLRLEGVIASRFDLAERWLAAAARTFSLDRPEASNRFGQDLKEVAKRHGFDGAFFAPGVGTRIGLKTNVATVAYRIVAEGKYAKALALLQELYRTPYLTQITKLTATPIAQPGRARDEVKLEFTIETPILPPIDRARLDPTSAARRRSPPWRRAISFAPTSRRRRTWSSSTTRIGRRW